MIRANGVRLHYVTAGSGDPVVLLHGFPQTWWEWHHVIPALAEHHTVIAPDYRGAGLSERPLQGYDKKTMAVDIRELVQALGFQRLAGLVGHDIGLMVAYAYAAQFPDEVARLVLVDAPLPGTATWDRLRHDPRLWHFAFHGARDFPEMLVAGKEREYLNAFFNVRMVNSTAIGPEDVDVYVQAYTTPGAMRAGFELYRAFDQDDADNRELIARGKLPMPVLGVGGEASTSGSWIEGMAREVAGDVIGLTVPGAAHWVPEESPELFTDRLLAFLR